MAHKKGAGSTDTLQRRRDVLDDDLHAEAVGQLATEHRRLGRLVDAIDTARAGNGGGV